MLEFIYEVLRPVNLPFTALMAMVVFYWLLVLLGALDFDSEPSVDIHSHDVHVDGAAGAHDVGHAHDVSHDLSALSPLENVASPYVRTLITSGAPLVSICAWPN